MPDSLLFPELPTYLFVPSLGGLLSLALNVILPVLAALLMKQSWSTSVKGTVLLLFSAVKSLIEAWIAANDAGQAFNLTGALTSTAVVFGVAVLSYFGLLKNTSWQRAAITSGVKDRRTIDGTYRD
jgi:hypothetical protein